MMRFVWLIAAFLATASPANASMAIQCTSPHSNVNISVAMGTLPVASIIDVQISADNYQKSMSQGDLHMGQAFSEAGTLKIDLTDPNVEQIQVRIRLNIASEGPSQSIAGTVAIAGQGAHAIICEGP